jgi:hypothetical protein
MTAPGASARRNAAKLRMVKTSHEMRPIIAEAPPPPGLEVPAECAGWRLDAALAKLFPEHSRSRLQGWLKEGLIRVDGAAAEAQAQGLWRRAFDAVELPAAKRNSVAGRAGADSRVPPRTSRSTSSSRTSTSS